MPTEEPIVEPTWVEGVDPTDWRNQPDPDGDDDNALDQDESLPTPQYVIDVLGFDPDEEDWDTTENEQANWWELLGKSDEEFDPAEQS